MIAYESEGNVLPLGMLWRATYHTSDGVHDEPVQDQCVRTTGSGPTKTTLQSLYPPRAGSKECLNLQRLLNFKRYIKKLPHCVSEFRSPQSDIYRPLKEKKKKEKKKRERSRDRGYANIDMQSD
jgi:hypothetical protein